MKYLVFLVSLFAINLFAAGDESVPGGRTKWAVEEDTLKANENIEIQKLINKFCKTADSKDDTPVPTGQTFQRLKSLNNESSCGALKYQLAHGSGDVSTQKDLCSEASQEYSALKSQALSLCKKFNSLAPQSSDNKKTPEVKECALDLDSFNDSCTEEWTLLMEDGEVSDSSARELLNRCPFIASDLASQHSESDLKDLKKELREEKKQCQDDLQKSQKEIKQKEAALKKVQTEIQNTLQKSQTDASKQALESQNNLIAIQAKIKELKTTTYNKILVDYKSFELDSDSLCKKELIEKVVPAIRERAVYKSATGQRRMTSQSQRSEMIAAAKAAYERCVATNDNNIAKARMVSEVAFQDWQNKLNEATQMEQQLQSQLQVAGQEASQQTQQKLAELQQDQLALHEEYILDQQALKDNQKLCADRIGELTAEINSKSGLIEEDAADDQMQGALARQLGLNGSPAKELQKFSGISKEQADKADKEKEKIEEAIGKIEAASSKVVTRCCGESKYSDICKSFDGDPIIRHKNKKSPTSSQ